MRDKELRKLNRRELLEMMLELSRENDRLKAQLKQAQEQLMDKKLDIDNAGSIAEASLQVNKFFEAAQSAAEQYLDNIRMLSGRQEQICKAREAKSVHESRALLEETKRKCQAMENDAAERCAHMEQEARQKADKVLAEARKKSQNLTDEQSGSWKWPDSIVNGAPRS